VENEVNSERSEKDSVYAKFQVLFTVSFAGRHASHSGKRGRLSLGEGATAISSRRSAALLLVVGGPIPIWARGGDGCDIIDEDDPFITRFIIRTRLTRISVLLVFLCARNPN
jgi:hypothetical protein